MSFMSSLIDIVGMGGSLAFGNSFTFTTFLDDLIKKSSESTYKQNSYGYNSTKATSFKPENIKNVVNGIHNGTKKVTPLDYTENITFYNRINHNENIFRLGDIQFMIPPSFIVVSDSSPHESVTGIRARGSISIDRGFANRQITVTTYINGLDQINGYKVDSPISGEPYYVDGLREILAQYYVSPFVPVVNEYLNIQHNIFNVALNNLLVSTVEGYPNTFEVTMTLSEIDLTPYIEVPNVLFHDMIDWDLFRFNYQRLVSDNCKLKTSFPKVTDNSNDFKIYKIKSEVLSGKDKNDAYDDDSFIKVLDSKQEHIVINSIAFSLGNILPQFKMASHRIPTYQYIGGTDITFNISFETTDESLINKLVGLKSYAQTLSRQYKDYNSFGFIKIENQLINMTGTKYLIIDSIQTSTTQGFPGLFQVQFTCTSFDQRQKDREELVGMKPFINRDGTKNDAIKQDATGCLNKIAQDLVIETKMCENELYPDLHLPTYNEIDTFLEQVKNFRKINNLKELPYDKFPRNYSSKMINKQVYNKFVDPDFYVFYPIQYSDLDDTIIKKNYKGATNIKAVSTKVRNVQWGATMDAPEGYHYDANGNLVKGTATSTSENQNSYSAGATGNAIADTAISIVNSGTGIYVWGTDGVSDGRGHLEFDCSGFVCYILRQLGIAPQGYRTDDVGIMHDYTTPISKDELQPGDLVDRQGEHIAIYIGDGKTAEAMGSNYGVVIGNLGDRFNTFGRVNKDIPSRNIDVGTTTSSNVSNGVSDSELPAWAKEDHPEVMVNTAKSNNRNMGIFEEEENVKSVIRHSVKYGLDPAFVMAVFLMETGGDLSSSYGLRINNPGSIMTGSDYSVIKEFNTLDEGIEAACSNLYKGYITQGLTDIDSIAAVYCPVGADNDPNGTNAEWPGTVKQIYKQLTDCEPKVLLSDKVIFVGDGETASNYRYKKVAHSGEEVSNTVEEDTEEVYSYLGVPIIAKSPIQFLYDKEPITDKLDFTVNDLNSALIRFGNENVFKPIDIKASVFLCVTTSNNALIFVQRIFNIRETLANELFDSSTLFGTYKKMNRMFTSLNRDYRSGIFVDLMLQNHRGNLNRAFPTFAFLIEDDSGDWLDGRKLWSNYYIYKSVLDISIHQERSQPVHTATINISNLYHNLNTSLKAIDMKASIEKDPEYFSFVRWIYKKTGMLLGTPKLTSEMVDVKNTLYDQIYIKTGCNIHIRLGYGSSPIDLPIVFSGIVTDVTIGETVQLIAQSYGLELINNVISTKPKEVNSWHNYGSEASNVITNIMTERSSTFLNTVSKKWGETSAYGIEHFGIPRGHEELAIDKEYDILKNIYFAKYGYSGGSDEDSLSFKERLFCDNTWTNFDGEDNANFYLYNKTPWDIFQNMTQTIPEFVCQPMYHQFECRLFFGLPTWWAKYRYDFCEDSKGNTLITESAKSFSQFHYIDSMSDIIDNSIKTSTNEIYTNAVAMYTLGGDIKSTPTVYSDRTILSSYQKTKVLDTTLEQDYVGPDWFYEKFVCAVGKSAAIRMAVSNLIDAWNRAYTESVLIIGDSTIKPCDYLMINDSYAHINGLCQVREVVHSINVSGGFTTDITPDMIALSNMKESGIGNAIKTMLSFGTAYGACKNLRENAIMVEDMYNTTLSISRCLMSIANLRNNTTYISGISTLAAGAEVVLLTKKWIKTSEIALKIAEYSSKIKSVFSTASGALKTVETIKAVKTVTTGVKTIATTIKAGATAAGSVVPGIGNLVAYVVASLIIDGILGSIIDEFAYNNSITVIPLLYKNEPFITGVKGQTHLILGISDNSDEDSNGEKIKDDVTDSENKDNDSAS